MSSKCPFGAPLTKGLVRCRHAEEVVRRGGSEYDCRSADHHDLCTGLFNRLKAQALPAFGVEDDLTSMPHSVLVKVQSGGLLGLHRLMGGAPDQRIEDVAALVDAALQHFGALGSIPVGELEGDMTGFKLERRSRRG
jgi:hypothetical protein